MRRAAAEAFLCAIFLILTPGVSASASGPGPATAENLELVGHLDIEGGGMVDVQEGIAYTRIGSIRGSSQRPIMKRVVWGARPSGIPASIPERVGRDPHTTLFNTL